ncbi:uncharacterized protein EKO05_0006727 [Ascochyta rabiei]|uniref:uncharacterized protein n=1 Tax=Didymella rabiei TaxID=5454 RepID=UPI00220B01A3|nr:uncharacterized protein EKO05_0006727 [Ascochyta rabiei]UPX16318.1 hypothetical protein EKO05_0006727 [Ascochyta rabiei]
MSRVFSLQQGIPRTDPRPSPETHRPVYNIHTPKDLSIKDLSYLLISPIISSHIALLYCLPTVPLQFESFILPLGTGSQLAAERREKTQPSAMAGGRRNLRSTTSDVEELPPCDDLGQELDAQRRDNAPRVSPAPMEPPLNPYIRGGSATTAAGIATPDVLTPRVTQMESLQASIPLLLEALNEAELSGAPKREIEIRQQQFNRAVETLQRTHVGPTPGSHRPAFDEAGKIMRVLNNVQPKPKLGTDNKPPSTQQVDQWIKDIDTAFQYA